MNTLLSLLSHVGAAAVAMLLLLLLVAGATARLGAAGMERVLLGLAFGDLLIAALAVWLFCRRVAAASGSTLAWGLAAAVLMLIVLVLVALISMVAANR
ncbi:MAG: hypothetical protein HYZ17_18205 [Betaproteobacteria bacterium]|nr:hypothetical protein [Betaproteobacteria bacterium]